MTTIRFYPISIDSKVVDGRTHILLFGRTMDNTQICVIDENFDNYFYVISKTPEITKEQIEQIEKKNNDVFPITKTELVQKKYHDQKINAIKVSANTTQQLYELKDKISQMENVLLILESGIHITQKYLMDKGIIMLHTTEAEGEIVTKNMRVVSLVAEKVNPLGEDALKNIRALSFIIKTDKENSFDPKQDAIIAITIAVKEGFKTIARKCDNTNAKNTQKLNSESEVIQELKLEIEKFKPDIIIGFNSDSEELTYLKARGERYRIRLDLGLDHSTLKTNDSGGEENKTAEFTGMIHIDMLKFYNKNIELIHNKEKITTIQELAKTTLNSDIGKIDYNTYEDALKNQDISKFIEYWQKETHTLAKVFDQIYIYIIQLQKIVSAPTFNLTRATPLQLFEWHLIKNAVETQELVPNKKFKEQEKETIKEMHYPTKTGLYENIMVFDYNTIYAPIISIHNISHSTIDCNCCRDIAKRIQIIKDKEKIEDHWICTKKRGFLATTIENILSRKERVTRIIEKTKEQKEELSPALLEREAILKFLIKSVYHYLRYPKSRWYSPHILEIIDTTVNNYLTLIIEKAKKHEIELIFTDETMLFFTTKKDTETSILTMQSIITETIENQAIEYIDTFQQALFISDKEETEQKKYALKKEDGTIDLVGLETRKINMSKIAKQTQIKIIESIMQQKNEKEAIEIIKETIHDIKTGNVTKEEMIITKKLNRAAKEYDKISPSIMAAKRMQQKGIELKAGEKVEYIIIKGEGKISDKVRLPEETQKEEYDQNYYINNQILTSIEPIMKIFGQKKEDLLNMLETEEQKELKDYFKKRRKQ